MFPHLDAVENLSEVARLFLIFARRGVSQIEEAALIDACKRTAGLCSRYPRPEPALMIAQATGLVLRQGRKVTISELGHDFAASGVPGVDLSAEQAMLLVGSLLDDPVFARTAGDFLRNFQIVKGRLLTRRTLASSGRDESLLCRILQQVGALESSNESFILNPRFERIFSHLIVHRAKLSQAELLKRLEDQRQRADLAEVKVVELERARLTEANRPDLAEQVYQISVDDVGAGYDIYSFETDGTPRYIEVKSSVGSLMTFQWSEGERESARTLKGRYFIYFLPFSFTLPAFTKSILVLQDPIAMINAGILVEEACGYRVTSLETGAGKFKGPSTHFSQLSV